MGNATSSSEITVDFSTIEDCQAELKTLRQLAEDCASEARVSFSTSEGNACSAMAELADSLRTVAVALAGVIGRTEAAVDWGIIDVRRGRSLPGGRPMSVGGDSARVPVSRRAVVAGALATCVSLVGCGCSPGQGDGGAVMIWDAMGVSKDDPITDEQLAVAHVVCREEDALHVYDELVRTRRWPERLYGHLFERTMAGCFLAERMAEHYGATFTVTGGPHYGDVALFPGEPSYLGYEFDVQDDPRGVSSCSATLHFEDYLQYEGGSSISDSYFSIARTPEMRSFCWDALRADYRAAAEAHGVSEQAYGAVRANCRNEETGWTYDVDAPIEELTPCYAVNLGVYFDGRPPRRAAGRGSLSGDL